MESEREKVYVAIGADWYDGFSTLQWTLRKWSNQGITIVILHAPNAICKDYVYTPLGKLPTTTVSEEKLKALEEIEEANSEKILSRYISFCGRVKAQVINIEKNEEQPLHKQIIEKISSLRITKLVVSFEFIKSSSWKGKSALSGALHVFREKPDFCEMFVICGGRLVFLRDENDEGFIEDDRGFMITKLKKNRSIKNWLVKKFPENNTAANRSPDSPSSSTNNASPNQWDKCSQEIEQYANELMSIASLCEEEGQKSQDVVENEKMNKDYSTLLYVPENMDDAERIQVLKCRIQNAQDTIQLNRKQANASKEKREKAEWAIIICNTRAMELEACITEQVMKTVDLSKELDINKEEINELKSEVEEKRSKLSSILELQSELLKKHNLSSSAKARAEVRLEKAVRERADMVQEIEELRKHRDVLQRRIEFCKEKDAIGSVKNIFGFGFDFRQFSAADITSATEDFSERLRLKSDGRSKNVYKGRINHITVTIKLYKSGNEWSLESFTNKVKFLSQIRHPNILAMIGFNSELKCIVYEHTHNGSLHDALFSSHKSKNKSLGWHARVRIATEMCSAVSFLHKAKPKPMIHGNFNPSKIFLDRHNIAKLTGLKGPLLYEEHDIKSDIRAFGEFVLQLVSGKNWDVKMQNIGDLQYHLCGEWPMNLAVELCAIAKRCLLEEECVAEMPMREIDDVKRRADEIVAKDGSQCVNVEEEAIDDARNIPGAFLCPIYQDVMQNPHVAPDGFSYELEAIEEWLKTGRDTSPMTNLRLKHKLLTPNHTLKSLIQDWQNKRSTTAKAT